MVVVPANCTGCSRRSGRSRQLTSTPVLACGPGRHGYNSMKCCNNCWDLNDPDHNVRPSEVVLSRSLCLCVSRSGPWPLGHAWPLSFP